MKTTFKQFLAERRTMSMDYEHAVEFAKKYCLQFLKSGREVYRGTKGKTPIRYGDSSTSTRISGFTKSNFYNLAFSNLETWDGFPKRNRSFICATNLNIAENYGSTIYNVLIPDNTKIGVVPSTDIQLTTFRPSSDRTLLVSATTLNSFITNIQLFTDIKTKTSIEKAKTNWNDLKNLLEELVNIKEVDEIYHDHKKFSEFKDFLQKNGVEKGLNEIYNPRENDFKLVSASNADNIPRNNEVWFSGPALFLNNNYYKKVYQEVMNK